ncbi:signal peptide-containing protein [Mariniblastus sp.]|nr:signal peptide-containing protein [Mariniblastus sp.]
MMRCVKFGAGGLFVFFLGAFFLFGSELTSMLQTSARSLQESARESVPVEFELQRAKDRINKILPDLQSQVRMIAEEEVAIAALTKEVQQDEKRLLSEETNLAGLRDEMRTTQVSFKINHRNLDRQQLAEHLKSRFDHFKQGQNSLTSKQRLLDKRKDGLNAALAMLDQMRTRQSELKLKVESLAAQHRLIKASQIQTGTLADNSQLSQADQLLSHLETRLAVAQRVLDYRDDLYDLPAEETVVAETDVLAEFDHYFAPPSSELAAKMETAE